MEALYTRAETDALGKKVRRLKTLMWAMAAAGLAACVILCLSVNTANAGRLQAVVIAVSTVCGWAVILTWAALYSPARAERSHMEGVLAAGERETFEGVLSLEDGALHIPRSIWIRRVTLTGEDGRLYSLSILARKAACLPPAGTRIRAETVRKYILAWEVCP